MSGLLYILMCLSLVWGSPLHDQEPLRNCSQNNTIINCVGMEMVRLPCLPPYITEFYFSNNNVTVLEVDHDQGVCEDLTVLDLSYSGISFLEYGIFSYFPNLKKLHLQGNRICFNSLSKETFDPLNALKVLDISNNFMFLTTKEYPDLFTNLTSLEDLTIDSLTGNFSKFISNCESLKTLSIMAWVNTVTNDTFMDLAALPITTLRIWSGFLREIEANAFVHFPHLEILDLSHNPRLGFKNASVGWPSLVHTNISTLYFRHSAPYDNEIIELTKEFFIGLDKTNITKLSLYGNQIVTMEGVVNEYLPRIEHLTLAYNRLTQVGSIMQDLEKMDSLKFVDASNQAIRPNMSEFDIFLGMRIPESSTRFVKKKESGIDLGDVLCLVSQLYKFIGVDKCLHSDTEDNLVNVILEQETDLLHEIIERYSGLIDIEPCEQEIPDCLAGKLFPGMSIEDRYTIMACGLPDCRPENSSEPTPLPFDRFLPLYVPAYVKEVNLSSSLTMTVSTIPMLVLCNALSMEYLDYSNNGVLRIENPVVFINETTNPFTFNLANNGMYHISSVFADNTSVIGRKTEGLILSNNKLGNMFSEKGIEPISGMQNLKCLDLSNNMIKSLPQNTFEKLSHLRYLNLKQNALRSFTFDVRELKNLMILDMSSNLLQYIDKNTRKQLEENVRSLNQEISFTNNTETPICSKLGDDIFDIKQTGSNHLSLYLSENPLVCSCDTISFLEWANSHRHNITDVRIDDFDELKCVFYDRKRGGEESMRNFTEMDDILHDLRGCEMDKILMAALIPTAVITLIICLSILAHRHRWDIKFWFLNLTIKRKAEQLEENIIYMYDAFVVYPESSLRWVLDQLLPNLEGSTHEDKPLTLCVHDRDFIPGHAVDENIMQSIMQSRKTLLVLDHKFLQSNWCTFETQMAHHQAIDQGRDIIVAVLLEPESTILGDTNMFQTLRTILRRRTYIKWAQSEDADQRSAFWERLRAALRDPVQRPTQCVLCGTIPNFMN